MNPKTCPFNPNNTVSLCKTLHTTSDFIGRGKDEQNVSHAWDGMLSATTHMHRYLFIVYIWIVLKASYCEIKFLKEFVYNWHCLFLKCCIECTNEALWASSFPESSWISLRFSVYVIGSCKAGGRTQKWYSWRTVTGEKSYLQKMKSSRNSVFICNLPI